ncbi:hypothetical protein WIS52_14420 [Pseudonocardia nematodicida]|uniref:Uncharacterized protein n=1 Tax=Pseudonocardia nematodicida TaxID=1206997 RepID=A0ABV1KB08_9PSEU
MSEQADAISDLGRAGVLDALSWCGWAAYRGVMADFRPEAGHDQGWVGYSGHKLMLNMQDRVFSCEGFAVDESSPVLGADLVQAGISEFEYRSMPDLRPLTVGRDNLNLSPAWRLGQWRWLMSSAMFGRVEEFDWRQARPTKRRVAQEPFLEGPDLFTGSEDDPIVAAWRALRTSEDPHNLVVMHTVDITSGQFEGFLGRPRLSDRDDHGSWHWLVRLDDWDPRHLGRGYSAPRPTDAPAASTVNDAPVTLRKQPQQKKKP